MYHVTEAVQAVEGTYAVVGSFVVIGAPIHCALLHSMSDLKDQQMNVHCCLIWEFMLYKFRLSRNTVTAN